MRTGAAILRRLDGECQLTARLRLRVRTAVSARADAVLVAQPREPLAHVRLVRLGRVGAATVKLYVAGIEPRVVLLHPRHEVLTDGRTHVQDDRRGVVDAGLGASDEHFLEMLVVV